jgi:tripartite-type tricarboxylate transporter receptor subunit TctC
MGTFQAVMFRLPVLACAVAIAAGSALAQDYPSRPVRMVVPFPPGGSSDSVSRIVAQKLTEGTGQPFIVEPRPGAGGNIGTAAVAKSAADGYTVLFTAGSFAINTSLYRKLPYDPVKDFEPVVHVCTFNGILVVHASVAATSVRELIALAGGKPGSINFASAGSGTVPHLAGELFKSMARVEMTHIPYKGSGPALTDLLGGQVQVMFANMPGTLQHVRAGKLRVLAVTNARRSSVLPDTPTIAEAALPGYEAANWFGVFAPAGTPREIVTKLNSAFAKALKTPEVASHLGNEGADVIGGSPEQFRAFVQSEIAKWAPVVKASGAQVD